MTCCALRAAGKNSTLNLHLLEGTLPLAAGAGTGTRVGTVLARLLVVQFFSVQERGAATCKGYKL